MDEAEINQVLLGFVGANRHALTAYIALRDLMEGRSPTPKGARKRSEEIRQYLDHKLTQAQGKDSE